MQGEQDRQNSCLHGFVILMKKSDQQMYGMLSIQGSAMNKPKGKGLIQNVG